MMRAMMRAALVSLLITEAFAAEVPRRSTDHYQVTLRLPEGGLYAQEEMQIEFRVEDTAKSDPVSGFVPVVRASPEAAIDMPAMPGMPRFSEVAHAEGIPGDYGIHPTFAHGGEFRLRIAIRPPGGEPFTVEFPLEVADAEKAAKRKPLPPRFRLELTALPKKPKAGQPVEVRLLVRDRDNSVVSSFEAVHEALLHLVIVRRDLSQFAHEHPVLDADGTFRFTYTFAAGGEYRFFADLAPKGAGSQILASQLNVSGDSGAAYDVRRATSEAQRTAVDTTVRLISPDGLPIRKTVTVAFDLRDLRTNQAPADLQPYLGVAGHLMLIHEDASVLVHCHPGEDGTLSFLARFPKAGRYRGWLQFQRGGTIRTADFVFRTEAEQ